jgi:CRP-like cAMP-binding protein
MTKDEIFGYRPILCNDDSPVFISAIQDCEIEMIDKEVFISKLHQSLELNTLFLHYFGNEFRVLCNKISFFSLKPVNERVALTLLILSQKFSHSGDKNKIMDFSRKEIANYAGTIIETLSRQLKILSEMNAIKIKGRKITLTDTDLLFKKANI